jgi:hypothetical protein
MPAKSSKSKGNTRNAKVDRQSRQVFWLRVAFSIFALILVLSMVLSLVSTK